MDALMHYFNLNPSRLNGIITYLRNISKIRQEARKLKGVTGKKTTTFVEDASIKGFYNVEDRKNHEYRELYLGEGDSAVSALLSARNPKYQALFGVMGVVDNTIDMSLSQVMGKPTFSNLVNILGCGIGKDFDLSKLNDSEIEIINKIIKLLKNKNVTDISNMSHEEEGWKKTKKFDEISFEYAMNLNIIK